MRVAVTGASGAIGTYVLRELLAAGHDASCVSRTAPAVDGADFAAGDVEDLETLERAFAGCDAVVHLAGITGPNWTTPDRLMEINLVGTIHVLEAAAKTGVRTVVFASSAAVTGFSFQTREISPAYLPLDEDHPPEPHDPYGLGKLLGEISCARYTRALQMRTLCLRLNFTWFVDREGAELAIGSAGWGRGLEVAQVWERYEYALLDPEAERPRPGPPLPRHLLWALVDARDVASAFRLAVENETLAHEVLNVSGRDTCSFTDTPTLLARHFPDVPVRTPLRDHDTLISHERAARLLGYRPRYSWRESDFFDWLASRLRSRGREISEVV